MAVKELEQNINGKKASYLCHTCKNALQRGKFPSMSVSNGLSLKRLCDPDLKLSEIENSLIAQNIIFQKIFLLPKSRMSAVKDRLVNVPITAGDVINTVKNIPRTPKEAGLIQVKLKRQLKYKSYHKQEYIDPNKIFKILKYLKDAKHPFYQFYDDYNHYKKRCREESLKHLNCDLKTSRVTVQFINDEDIPNIMNMDMRKETNMINEMEDGEENIMNDEEHYIKNDPTRKYQFDHNISTCLTNKFPEITADINGEEVVDKDDLSFAPGEGKIPSNILMEKDWDIKGWPTLHPDGQFGLHHKREVRLTDQNYFVQRIRNADRRFEENAGYVFAATSYIEKKRLQSNANISFSRGQQRQNDEGGIYYSLNDPYTVFDNIKNTPKYWQKYKYEMIARLENLGPFQWFFTLSCADQKWDENFSSLIRERDIEIEYEVSNLDGSDTTWITFLKDGEKKKILLKDYLEEEVDESQHEMIRTNVLNATRNFQRRVDAFIKHIILGKDNPMNIKHLSYKVEFQGRGAGHIHGVLWSRISKFESKNLDDEDDEFQVADHVKNKEFKYLTSAFRKLRDNQPMNIFEKVDIERFVDKFVTCSLNPDKLGKVATDGYMLAKLAKDVQTHRHTRTCHKYDNSCRFHKPSFPMKETTLFESMINSVESDKQGNDSGANPKVLEKVKDLLDDNDLIEKIMNKYDKENETEFEYKENLKRRIDELLEIAGTSYEEYKKAIQCSVTRGHCILLQ